MIYGKDINVVDYGGVFWGSKGVVGRGEEILWCVWGFLIIDSLFGCYYDWVWLENVLCGIWCWKRGCVKDDVDGEWMRMKFEEFWDLKVLFEVYCKLLGFILSFIYFVVLFLLVVCFMVSLLFICY